MKLGNREGPISNAHAGGGGVGPESLTAMGDIRENIHVGRGPIEWI